MPVGIGSAENTFANPIGLLSNCHRRIERFLQVLVRVTEAAQGGTLDASYRSGLETALKYFRDAAPKHTADDEEDLFPMLRAAGRERAEQLLARVNRLEEEHRTAKEWHRQVERLGQRWLHEGHLQDSELMHLSNILTALSELYRAHIEIEDREAFPVAQEELSKAEKEAMGRRMALRRGVPFMPAIVTLKSSSPDFSPRV